MLLYMHNDINNTCVDVGEDTISDISFRLPGGSVRRGEMKLLCGVFYMTHYSAARVNRV